MARACVWSCLLTVSVGVAPPAVIPQFVARRAALPSRSGASTVRASVGEIAALRASAASKAIAPRFGGKPPLVPTHGLAYDEQTKHPQASLHWHVPTASAMALAISLGALSLAAVMAVVGGRRWWQRALPAKSKDFATEMAIANTVSASSRSFAVAEGTTMTMPTTAFRCPIVAAGRETMRVKRLAVVQRTAAQRSETSLQQNAVAEDAEKVVLMGDSVLDNFVWLQTPERPLRVQLEEQLQKRQQSKLQNCINLAVDQMTTFDFEERTPFVNSWEYYAQARAKVNWASEQDRSYVVDPDGVIRSINNLKRLDNVSAIVLSIGGNDVYLNNAVKSELALSVLPSYEGKRFEVAREFGQRYRQIVQALRNAVPSAALVLVIPYQPHREFSLVMGAPVDEEGARVTGDFVADFVRGLEQVYLNDLVTPMVKEILLVSQEQNCPVVDLSRTLDPQDEAHYGTGKIGEVNDLGVAWSGAEPSDLSCGFTAELLSHALARPQEAVVYSGTPRKRTNGDAFSLNIKEEKNDYVFAEDYRFGGGGTGGRYRKIVPGKDESDAGTIWFGVGVAITLAINLPTILQGGDAPVFNRSEYIRLLDEAAAEKEGMGAKDTQDAKSAADTAAAGM